MISLFQKKNNPPNLEIFFFDEKKDLNRINCFSNEGNQWQNTETSLKDNKLLIKFRDKFKDRRGRINCSLNDNGNWRWLGLQFTINNN